jgi:hypothetical protein
VSETIGEWLGLHERSREYAVKDTTGHPIDFSIAKHTGFAAEHLSDFLVAASEPARDLIEGEYITLSDVGERRCLSV